MNRKDLGFIVSRGLAVWVAYAAIGNGFSAAGLFDLRIPVHTYSFAPDVPRAVIALVILTVCEAGLSSILWLRAARFGNLTSWTPPVFKIEGVDGGARQAANPAHAVMLSAAGLYAFVRGGATAVDINVARWAYSSVSSRSRSLSHRDWRVYAFEAALGAVIFFALSRIDRQPIEEINSNV